MRCFLVRAKKHWNGPTIQQFHEQRRHKLKKAKNMYTFELSYRRINTSIHQHNIQINAKGKSNGLDYEITQKCAVNAVNDKLRFILFL